MTSNKVGTELPATCIADDASEGKDPAKFKVLLSPVTLTIDVPPRPGETEGTTYLVGAGGNPTVHRFFLVRGDVAVGLVENQPADDKHWYLWRWLDESTDQLKPLPLGSTSDSPAQGEQQVSWGRIKAVSR